MFSVYVYLKFIYKFILPNMVPMASPMAVDMAPPVNESKLELNAQAQALVPVREFENKNKFF